MWYQSLVALDLGSYKKYHGLHNKGFMVLIHDKTKILFLEAGLIRGCKVKEKKQALTSLSHQASWGDMSGCMDRDYLSLITRDLTCESIKGFDEFPLMFHVKVSRLQWDSYALSRINFVF
ncbi:hypothetical protein Tco_0886874, partial [Tanacetum coccineum]